jgi:site-specific DNA-cytosine methylase
MTEHIYTVLHLFCGLGGGSLGFAQARASWRGLDGRFKNVAGVDVDPDACAAYEALTGSPAHRLDLFSREDYEAFHGHEPPAEWQEVSAQLLRDLVGECPDVVFLSAPCKGFSGLLPTAQAESAKYQALNRLALRAVWLLLEAWPEGPRVILFENVPRIRQRGADLLRQIEGTLKAYGFAWQTADHDAGVIGGLGQHRMRFLGIGRNTRRVKPFVYQPPALPLLSIGDVLSPLPLPDDPRCGSMHRLPRLKWITWLRLALIRAGKDWRDLRDMPEVQLEHEPRRGVWRVVPGSDVLAVAEAVMPDGTVLRANGYRIQRWEATAHTVTGAVAPIAGGPCVADPRLGCEPRRGTYGVMAWDQTAPTVIGSLDVHAGTAAVADPRPAPDRDYPVIVSLDGTWHRPLTTLELAALQGLPMQDAQGKWLELPGSDAKRRELIGNAVPPPAARAMAETILVSLLASSAGVGFILGSTPVWVDQYQEVAQ